MNGAIDGPVLAIDSSTRGGSVAVGLRGRIVSERVLEATVNASSLLMPAVDAAVRHAGLAPRDVAGVVVSGGPGSFTGLRIAAATAKAVVRALDVPLLAYSGLMAAAATLRHAGRPVCALFDARNREVFAGCWRFADGAVDELLAPAILPLDDVVARVHDHAPLFTGDGAEAYRYALAVAAGEDAVGARDEGSYSTGLIWLARIAPALGRVERPATWEPDYLRASGAERIAGARAG